ncbi:hypothetical protein FRC09_015508, partial [Ceratobasidium sp. 395]
MADWTHTNTPRPDILDKESESTTLHSMPVGGGYYTEYSDQHQHSNVYYPCKEDGYEPKDEGGDEDQHNPVDLGEVLYLDLPSETQEGICLIAQGTISYALERDIYPTLREQ